MTQSVYALRSFKKSSDGQFGEDGFLLFPSEVKSNNFLEMCEHMNSKEKICHYEKHGEVQLSEYITGRVNSQNHYFVRSLEPHQVV